MAHAPVMLREVVATLAPRPGALCLDATFGGGGYAAAILAQGCTLYAIDRDPAAIARGAALAARHPGRLHLVHGRFGGLLDLLAERGVTGLDGIVFDLGVSSFQLDEAARGFSFRADGPLDMRMDDSAGRTAATLVNALPEAELAELLWRYGEERHSRRIARRIVAARAAAPILTTLQLAELVRASVPWDPSGIDGATRAFQALRIAVNDELGELERGLAAAAQLLTPGARLVVVAFHSLEDRLVKRFMAEAAGRGGASRHDPAALAARPEPPRFRLVTPRALRPQPDEIAANPRARSARLRALARLGDAA
jgi:16S rRNA (cytosine1402-N4)-methyltransferase